MARENRALCGNRKVPRSKQRARTGQSRSQRTDLRPLTVGLLAPTSDNVPSSAVLKSSGGLSSCGVGARQCLGQSPASFGVGRPRGRCPLVRQHHGPGIPRCRPRCETLGLMAWKCLHGTMTLREQLWLSSPGRPSGCLPL